MDSGPEGLDHADDGGLVGRFKREEDVALLATQGALEVYFGLVTEGGLDDTGVVEGVAARGERHCLDAFRMAHQPVDISEVHLGQHHHLRSALILTVANHTKSITVLLLLLNLVALFHKVQVGLLLHLQLLKFPQLLSP